jgi:hypothetical protein
MSQTFNANADDGLLRLWQDSAIATPDPERLTRSVGRMALARFDREVFQHDLREYGAFVFLLLFFSGQAVFQGDLVQAAVGIAGGLFVVSYLWWQHRRLTPLDPSADGRGYQAALLDRLDGEIRLLKNIRYWYLAPLYLPVLWTVAAAWRRNPLVAFAGWMVMTAVYVAVAWLCERVAVRRLTRERDAVASLYAEEALRER